MRAERIRLAVMASLGLVVCLLLAGNAALATPVILIDTLPEWNDALGGGGGGGGYIEPVDADVFRDLVWGDSQWPDDYRDAKFYTPTLYVMEHEDSQGKIEPGLVMYWGDPARGPLGDPPQLPQEGEQVAAAWDFVYPLDPVFSASNWIEFSIHAPVPGMYVSVNLIDAAGGYREWIWSVGDPNDPADAGKIPACVWTDVAVNPVTLASNYAYESVFEFGGFNLNNIERIRFDENMIWSSFYTVSEPGSGVAVVWNAWDHVAENPEPATMLLLGGGLLALARRRRRRT